MGIRLDWEIEAEQSHVKRSGEDPSSARRRRIARLRIVLFVLVILALLAGVGAFIVTRLREYDAGIEKELRNTVDAEVAALRIGDFTAFSAAQRSASDDWLKTQQQLFNDYQGLKTQKDLRLTGDILEVAVDHTRARVKVQEIIDGVPYTRVWFYWLYDDGWRHVPPDYTFWGEVKTSEGQGVSVRFQTVDDGLASALTSNVSTWIATGCSALVCGNLPDLLVEVVPDEALEVSWSAGNPWLLQIPSPFVGRARSDKPFDIQLQFKVASLLAERLVTQASGNLQPAYPADAYYLKQAVISWLVGKFVQLNTNAFIMNSLASNYGDAAVGRLLASLKPDSSVTLLAGITGVASIDQANLDWRDYFTWRVTTEDNLIRQRDDTNFLALYDTRDENARNLAYQRFNAPAPEIKKVIVSGQLEQGTDGTPVIHAVMQVGEDATATQQDVWFRLADGVWKRIN